MTKTDYMVICGDFGGVWNADRRAVRESPAEKDALDWLDEKPFTTLFVPGNHENYDRLTGCRNESLMRSWFYAKMPPEEKEKLKQGYPRLPWHGGFVRQVRPSVLMLENGGDAWGTNTVSVNTYPISYYYNRGCIPRRLSKW